LNYFGYPYVEPDGGRNLAIHNGKKYEDT